MSLSTGSQIVCDERFCFKLVFCLMYFESGFSSAYSKVDISTVVVCGMVCCGRGQIDGSHKVKPELVYH